MSHPVLSQQGHAVLPLVVTLKRDKFYADRHYIEVSVAGTIVYDIALNGEAAARFRSDFLFKHWVSVLQPVFDLGYSKAVDFIAEGA